MSERPAPTRTGRSRRAALPFALLTATDAVAIATLARCFSGPGELLIAVPVCIVVHLLAGGLRRLSEQVAIGALGWVAALAACVLIPVYLLEPRTLTAGLPLGATWSVVHSQLGYAWSIFSTKVSPVAEAPGLVLATAWAAGAVAVASEILYADSGLPAILALVPAFDVVVFTGTLGTTSGRAVELAAIAGLALAFLVTAQSDRSSRRVHVTARTDVVVSASPGAIPGTLASAPAARGRQKLSETPGRRLALGGITLVAALAAGVIGPLLPGATSPPLIAWHGPSGLRSPGNGGHAGGPPANTDYVSDLVQVAEQEVKNPDGLLFTVHSTERTREALVYLDNFNGNAWSRSTGTGSSALDQFSSPIAPIEQHPPAARTLLGGAKAVEQVINIGELGGEWLPAPGVPDAIDGLSNVSMIGSSGPLATLQPLNSDVTYALRATLPTSSATLLSSVLAIGPLGPARDLLLPGPVPASIKNLAHQIAADQPDPYEIAESLQDYFTSGHGFSYELPSIAPNGSIANTAQSYKALESFLFTVRSGYCQQYATAFAVLARILGLPTRVVVGFVPGKEIAKDTYEVTGQDVHAWPEVHLAQYGWITFEPTPGFSSPSSTVTTTTTAPGPSVSSVTTTTVLAGHNFAKPPSGPVNGHRPKAHHHKAKKKAAGHSASSGLADILAVLVALGLAWALVVPLGRLFVRASNRRDPRRATASAWRAASSILAAAGTHRRRSETHLEFVDRVGRAGILSEEANQALRRLAEEMDVIIYAPARPPSSAEQARAAAEVAWQQFKTVSRSARKRIAWWQQFALLVDPRDFMGAA